jgi:microcystin-dependent protein
MGEAIADRRGGSMDAFIGEIKLVGFNFAPQGWAPCDSSIMSIGQNTALFSLLGATYGGDGRTTFALPDLRGAAPADPNRAAPLWIIALSGVFPPRD